MKIGKIRMMALAAVFAMVIAAAAVVADSPSSDANGDVAKIGDTGYKTLADAVAAANTGETVEIIKADTYTVPGISKNIIIKGTDGVNFNAVGSGSIASIPNGCTFENVTFDFGQTKYHGFQGAGHIKMNDCVLNGLLFSYGNMTFDGCTFNQTSKEYCMWCYAGNVTYIGCTANVVGKCMLLYNEGNSSEPWKVAANGCTFKSSESKKAAFNVKETCGDTGLKYDVQINNCTTDDPWPSPSKSDTLIVFDPLVQVDDRNKDVNAKILITLNNKQVYPVLAAKIGETEYGMFKDALNAVQDGQTITLLDNFVMSEEITIQKNITIDLNAYKYSISKDNELEIEGGVLFKNGNIQNEGTITNGGSMIIDCTLINSGTIVNSGTITNKGFVLDNGTLTDSETITNEGLVSGANASGWGVKEEEKIEVDPNPKTKEQLSEPVKVESQAVQVFEQVTVNQGKTLQITVEPVKNVEATIVFPESTVVPANTIIAVAPAKQMGNAFEVKFDGVQVPTGTVVKITLPASSSNSEVFYVNGDTRQPMNVVERTSTSVTFETTHNSTYLVVSVASELEEEVDDSHDNDYYEQQRQQQYREWMEQQQSSGNSGSDDGVKVVAAAAAAACAVVALLALSLMRRN